MPINGVDGLQVELMEGKELIEEVEEIKNEIDKMEETNEKIAELREIHGLSESGTYQFTKLF